METLRFDEYQFKAYSNPVSADTGIAFEDFERMGREEHRLFFGREIVPPTWAVNLSEQKVLLARYFEQRANIHHPRIGTPEARLKYAQRKLLAGIPGKEAALDKLCTEYVELRRSGADPDRQEELSHVIRSLDTEIIMARRGPAPIVWLIYCHFRLGYDSVATAAETGIQPMTVRQIVFRLTRLWERMQSGADKKPKPIEIRRAANRAISQRLRANMTPEQREAFLQYHREYAKKNLRAAAVRKKRWYDIHADQIKKKRRGQVKKPSLGF